MSSLSFPSEEPLSAPILPSLLATDLDGTLAVNGRIGESEIQAASRLREAGIPILVITGRNLRSLGRTAEIWKVADSVLFSSGAGLLSGRTAEPEEKHRLSAADTRAIARIMDIHREDYCLLDPVPHTHHFAWRRHRPKEMNPDFDARMAIYREWARPWEDGAQESEVMESCRGACQVLAIQPVGTPWNPALEEALSSWSLFHSSSPIDHQSIWLEVFPAGVDKGRALADWCRSRGIDASGVMTLGNDYNDRSMLDWSGTPRVVGNAPEELRSLYKTFPPAGQGGFESAVDEILNQLS